MPISQQKKLEYSERLKEYKVKLEELDKNIKELTKTISANKGLANYARLSISNLYLNKVYVYFEMNDLSVEILGIKNEGFLMEARTNFYKALTVLEEIVGNFIDAPLTEQEENLKTIEKLDDAKRYHFLKKIDQIVAQIQHKFGSESKWKWSFVDMEGRSVTVIKNLIDFKAIQAKNDPRIEGYTYRMDTLRFIKEKLKTAAERYREKYEVVSQEPGEMKKAINFLAALMRIHILFNEGEEANNLKKTIQIWQEKLDADLKKIDEKKKQQLLKR